MATTVRWVVLFTGRKATEDYQPASSEGEDPALVREITNVCLALHPHSEIRLFPQSGDALLYYRAGSGSEAVITRVSTAPNPDGVRTALEYCSLVLSDADLQKLLGGDPFVAARSTDLFDRVRAQFLSGSRAPIPASPPAKKAAPIKPPTASTDGTPGEPGDELLSTPENIAALEARCAAAAASGAAVPTFATWWSSSGMVPPHTFEIVLRAPVARALTLREASDLLTVFAADVKTALPKTSAEDAIANDLARAILASADSAQQAVAHAATHINTETPAQFQSHLTEASLQSSQIIADIAGLTARLGSQLDEADSALMMNLSARAEDLSRELPRVRHPNPFARRTVTSESAASDSGTAAGRNDTRRPSTTPAAPASRNGALIGAGAVVVAALAGFGVWSALGHGGKTPSPSASGNANSKPASATIPVVNNATPAPRPTRNPVVAALTSEQKTVEPIAQASAKKAAAAAVAKAKGDVSEDQVETITSDAITAAYKDALSSAQYKTVYGGGKTWTYSHYQTAVPALAYSVHEAAHDAVVEGAANLKIAKAEATPPPTPKPKATETPSDESTPKPRHHHTEEASTEPSKPKKHEESAPEHHSSPPKSTPTAPKAGTAGQTGL